jgi:hypothetical protein
MPAMAAGCVAVPLPGRVAWLRAAFGGPPAVTFSVSA